MNPPATQHATPDGHDWHELEVANPSFAVITRRAGRLSPGVRELITDLEAHMQAVTSDFDRSPDRSARLRVARRLRCQGAPAARGRAHRALI